MNHLKQILENKRKEVIYYFKIWRKTTSQSSRKNDRRQKGNRNKHMKAKKKKLSVDSKIRLILKDFVARMERI